MKQSAGVSCKRSEWSTLFITYSLFALETCVLKGCDTAIKYQTKRVFELLPGHRNWVSSGASFWIAPLTPQSSSKRSKSLPLPNAAIKYWAKQVFKFSNAKPRSNIECSKFSNFSMQSCNGILSVASFLISQCKAAIKYWVQRVF